MNDEMDEALNSLLRGQFEGPVPDDGFCDRVMELLPSKRHQKNWPLVVGILTGTATCALTLWSAPITSIGWQEWVSGVPSEFALALFISMIGLEILALAWAVAEVGDRDNRSSRQTIR